MAANDTPVMRQYREVQAEHPDAVLLMRMGDFYEAFFGSAEDLARICGVALTSRNKDAPEPIPMAGVPHHSLGMHLPRLLAAGRRVAVMDQLEDPAQAKGLVRRGLTRVLSAGTLVDEQEGAGSGANWLVAITGFDGPIGIAALDVSTGRLTVEDAADAAALGVVLARLAPAELVVPAALADAPGTRDLLAQLCSPATPPIATQPAFAFHGGEARRTLATRFRVSHLDAFGIAPGDDHLCAAAAAALRYAEGALRAGAEGGAQGLTHVRGITRIARHGHLELDATCRRNLDLLRASRDNQRAGSLLSVIDRTATAPGARLTAEWLARPLADASAISQRHDAVTRFVEDDALRSDVREALARVYDLERVAARLATGRCSARDLVHLATSLEASARVQALLHDAPALLAGARARLSPCPELVAAIRATVVDDPPPTMQDGGMVRDGVDAELDRLRSLVRDGDAWLADYQQREAAACGLPRLKVGYNSVFGYYIELSKAHAEKVPGHFVRKQTLVNAERYITPELKDYEEQALSAGERSRACELRLINELRDRAVEAVPAVQSCAAALAAIDALAGLAETARRGGWCRPVVDDGTLLDLCEARHPVVEQAVGRGRFTANDCRLDPLAGTRLQVITGPNMSGKSTYIRQVALCVILAQMGSFVPARSAHLGLVDRVFTRVGAGDELARGQSTFMVEMSETAQILRHATARSLVVLDEVGRGTSTFDGVSLAWAIVEDLHDRITCRALFATHYHELTDLAQDRTGIANMTVAVAEQDGAIAFLHRIQPGAAAKSYGIQVARLAGVPDRVVARAGEVLTSLEGLNATLAERERPSAAHGGGSVQLTLWQAMATAGSSPTADRLRSLDLDNLTPRKALELLAELQAQARAEG